jgi:hypothetical protein
LLAAGRPLNQHRVAELVAPHDQHAQAQLAELIDGLHKLMVSPEIARETALFVRERGAKRRLVAELASTLRHAAAATGDVGLGAYIESSIPDLATALGGQAERLQRALEEAGKASGQTIESRFKVRGLSQFRQPQVPALVRGLIGLEDLILVYGAWSSGKSFFALDMLSCIAFGDMWRGRKCEAGLGIYVAGEAAVSIESRCRAWLLRRGKLTKGAAEPPIGVVGCAPNLLNGGAEVADLCSEIDAFRVAYGLPIRIIVIDTVHSAAPGSREDAGDFGAVLANVKVLSQHFQCAIALIHHSGKDSSRGARGSNSLEAAADVIIEVVEDKGVRTPIVRKLRDGDLPELEPFTIDSVVFEQESGPVRVGVHELTEPPPARDDDDKKALARELRASGMTCQAVANRLGVTKGTVSKWCR